MCEDFLEAVYDARWMHSTSPSSDDGFDVEKYRSIASIYEFKTPCKFLQFMKTIDSSKPCPFNIGKPKLFFSNLSKGLSNCEPWKNIIGIFSRNFYPFAFDVIFDKKCKTRWVIWNLFCVNSNMINFHFPNIFFSSGSNLQTNGLNTYLKVHFCEWLTVFRELLMFLHA